MLINFQLPRELFSLLRNVQLRENCSVCSETSSSERIVQFAQKLSASEKIDQFARKLSVFKTTVQFAQNFQFLGDLFAQKFQCLRERFSLPRNFQFSRERFSLKEHFLRYLSPPIYFIICKGFICLRQGRERGPDEEMEESDKDIQ